VPKPYSQSECYRGTSGQAIGSEPKFKDKVHGWNGFRVSRSQADEKPEKFYEVHCGYHLSRRVSLLRGREVLARFCLWGGGGGETVLGPALCEPRLRQGIWLDRGARLTTKNRGPPPHDKKQTPIVAARATAEQTAVEASEQGRRSARARVPERNRPMMCSGKTKRPGKKGTVSTPKRFVARRGEQLAPRKVACLSRPDVSNRRRLSFEQAAFNQNPCYQPIWARRP